MPIEVSPIRDEEPEAASLPPPPIVFAMSSAVISVGECVVTPRADLERAATSQES